MQIYTVCFFGHRDLHDLRKTDESLIPLLRELLRTKPFVVFLVGRNGGFDEYISSVIKRIQKEVGKENSELTLVLPYKVADIEYYNEYYDSVIIPDCVAKSHPKSAITLRNRWMAEQSELVIVNVERDKGGAYTAMRYAQKHNKKIVNLCTQKLK